MTFVLILAKYLARGAAQLFLWRRFSRAVLFWRGQTFLQPREAALVPASADFSLYLALVGRGGARYFMQMRRGAAIDFGSHRERLIHS
jgi:hypothetical protein